MILYLQNVLTVSRVLTGLNKGEFKNWANLSPGQRADKLLDIVLNGDSGKILLIDQPEDDLDNETIYKTITRKIRDLKLRRQIILVTHNANIAITGDSDVSIMFARMIMNILAVTAMEQNHKKNILISL